MSTIEELLAVARAAQARAADVRAASDLASKVGFLSFQVADLGARIGNLELLVASGVPGSGSE